MGKLKARSKVDNSKQQTVVVPKLSGTDINPPVVGPITFVPNEPIPANVTPVETTCVCPVEMSAINVRLDAVMKSMEEIKSRPESKDTKLDAYIKSNNETLKSMSDDFNKLKTQVSMAKSEVKVVENVIDYKNQDQTEKRQEMGLELDRLQQSHTKRMAELTNKTELMEIENNRLLKTVKVMKLIAGLSAVLALVNIFI